jgi:hypothetical protein
MAPPPRTNTESTAKTQDNIAARVAGSSLWSEWKQNRERKRRLKRRTVLSDCRLMLRYALDEGYRISDQLSKDIAKIDAVLIQDEDRDLLSEVPKDVILKAQSGARDQQPQAQEGAVAQSGAEDQQSKTQQGAVAQSGAEDQQSKAQQCAVAQSGAKDQQPQAQQAAGPVPTPTPTPTPELLSDVIMRVHNALSDLVAPATAQSLRATDPAIVSWGLPFRAKFAMLGALASTVFFIIAVSNPKPEASGKPPSGSPARSPSQAAATATPSSPSPTASPSPQKP